MHMAEPALASWQARLDLEFEATEGRTVLAGKRFEGPLAIQKPLYPEGEGVCHAILLHPPGGIAGGDELHLNVGVDQKASVLLTTPGAGKWYRSAGPWASQRLQFDVAGRLEWLPRETIVFDRARARLESRVHLRGDASYIGWEVACLGRAGSGERFSAGEILLHSEVRRNGKLLWLERGRIDGGGRLMSAAAGLGGRTVAGTMVAASVALARRHIDACRAAVPAIAITLLPGVLVARYLGDSGEQAMQAFTRVWALLRPELLGRAAVEPRIWRT